MSQRFTRRQFLLASLAGAGGLLGWYLSRPQDLPQQRVKARHLSATQLEVLAMMAPSLLYPIRPDAQQLHNLLQAIDQAYGYLPASTQQELSQLLDLLHRRGSFLLLSAGMSDLSKFSINQRIQLLNYWRFHSLALLNQAYQGLHELVMASWYGDSANWPALDYQLPEPFKSFALERSTPHAG
ncbi:hypothetical protein [Aliagarivorans taiwanensis]|uniref:hypothetical protein n=1 Tax=Aliagarivorans taiwanensis TaxID=561966 RepID=UPI000425AA1D|nr:hypothetical protein [Aliagarivorans taiwanensis]